MEQYRATSELRCAGVLDAFLLDPVGNPSRCIGNSHAADVHTGRGVGRLSQPRRESALVISAVVRDPPSRTGDRSRIRIISCWNPSGPLDARCATQEEEQARTRSHPNTKTPAQDREVHLELPAGRQHPVCARAAFPASADRSLGCRGSKPLALRGVAARPGSERDALGSPGGCRCSFTYMAAVQFHGKKRGANGS